MSSTFKLKLIRKGGLASSLPLVDKSICIGNEELTRKTFDNTVNDVKVQYAKRHGLLILSIVAVGSCLWGNYVLMSDGTLWAFGDGYLLGCCVDFYCDDSNTPVRVNLGGTDMRKYNWDYFPDWSLDMVPQRIVFISGDGDGSDSIGFLDTNGQLWGLGDNDSLCQEGVGDQLGGGYDCLIAMGGSYEGEHNFKFVSVGNHHTLAIDTDGYLWAWGRTTYGAVGDGKWWGGDDSSYTCYPFHIIKSGKTGFGEDISNKTWSWCSAGWYNSIAIDTEGRLWTWGANYDCDLGHGSVVAEDYWLYPTAIWMHSDKYWVKCWGSEFGNAAMTDDGKVWFACRNHYAQIGNGFIEYGDPIPWLPDGYFHQGGGGETYVDFDYGAYWSMGTRMEDGVLKTYVWGTEICCGIEGAGNLGLGKPKDYVVILPREFPIPFRLFNIGTWHGIGVDYDNNIWVWGDNIGGSWPPTDPPVTVVHDWFTGE